MKKNYLVIVVLILCLKPPIAYSQNKPVSFKEYIMNNVASKEEIDVFLHGMSWAKFEPEVGYKLGNFMPHDGVDNSSTLSTSKSNGARTSFMYSGKPCRINTYGNSFTQCHQVNDGETWQEYLAANLGEPIRNFGMGGYGVNQSYRRMIQEESKVDSAKNILFYIWGDDHIRSLLRCRYMLIKEWMREQDKTEKLGRMFHGNFWDNIEMDLEKGILVEKKSLINSPDSLYNMADPLWMYNHLKDDLALQMALYKRNEIKDIDFEKLRLLARFLNSTIDPENDKDKRKAVSNLLDKYAFAATKFILKKVKDFAEKKSKKLLVVIFDPYQVTNSLILNKSRYDQEIVNFLTKEKFNYFDMNVVHAQEYKLWKLSLKDYYNRYFIGHYNPAGNHFFAFSIKSAVVKMLDPKPITYQFSEDRLINFKGYLEGYE
jgi:hypothetical protein